MNAKLIFVVGIEDERPWPLQITSYMSVERARAAVRWQNDTPDKWDIATYNIDTHMFDSIDRKGVSYDIINQDRGIYTQEAWDRFKSQFEDA